MSGLLSESFAGYEAFRPPKRVSVAEGAAQNLVIRSPGGYNGPWSPEETPYMVEPMNTAASRRHEAVCFIGPSRTGKTQGLIDGFLTYVMTCDPGDMLIVQQSQEKAREFAKTRVDRAIRHSPSLASLMTGSANDHNTHDIMFNHGAWLRLGWPTVTQLSGSDYRYVALTDYDRMPENIDGEGDAYALALKRTQTFLSRGMCIVESSPGYELTDPSWKPATLHEAPPCRGIVGIYNRSDRRRWYWPCPHCDEFFEAAPGLGLFNLPDDNVLLEAVRHSDLDEIAHQHSRIVCPHCGSFISKTKKHGMNLAGDWLADGQIIHANRKKEGDPLKSNIAGFWMGGVSAAYQSWHSLVMRYLQGLREYALSGSELSLQTTTNTDQGAPYLPRLLAEGAKGTGGPEGRKDSSLKRFIVPDEARFLAASVDIQGGQNASFVVQVHAIGQHMEQWPIDRYSITESKREGFDGGFATLDPAKYPEDWDILTDLVVKATYRLGEDGKELRIRMIAVDTGGEGGTKKNGASVADGGVTANAYAWYRRLRLEQFHGRVMLIKGASTQSAPLIRESWVGGKQKGEKGDIPLYLLNTNQLKDAVSSILKREIPGPGYMHIPSWLHQSWFDELTAEVRKPDGTWMKVRKRNEAFDLCGYIRACCLRLGVDKPAFWEAPPPWALPLSENIDVISSDMRRAMQEAAKEPASAMRRRVTRSSYMR